MKVKPPALILPALEDLFVTLIGFENPKQPVNEDKFCPINRPWNELSKPKCLILQTSPIIGSKLKGGGPGRPMITSLSSVIIHLLNSPS